MSNRTLYFAYGSNMAIERLQARIASAELISVATLVGHALRFHVPSNKDGSAKCDAACTGNPDDRVHGALYSILTDHLPVLDQFEGPRYDRRNVDVSSPSGESFRVDTYVANMFDNNLLPFDWYKEHVLRGARAIGLPEDYITDIEVVVAAIDLNVERKDRELSIYG